MWTGSRLYLRALKWRAWLRWYWPPPVFPSLHHGPFLAPKNKGLAQCLQRPDVLLSVGLFPTVPPVRFPGDPCWLQLPDLAVQWSRPAGWAQWWSYKMVAPLKPSLSNPLGVNSSLPGSIYAQKKIPWLLNFPGATVTSCGLILMCFIWKYSFQSPLPLLAWKPAVWIQAASTAICSAHPRPDSKRTDGWQTCS